MSVLTFSRKQLLQSMLTGVPQIIQVKGCFRKLMKSLVLMGCFMGCTYQIWSFMEVFWTYPTNVNNIVSQPNAIEMPAFTICPFNGLVPNSFCTRFPNLCTPIKSYEDFCKENFNYCVEGYTSEPPSGTKVPAIPPSELPTNFTYVRRRYMGMGVQAINFIQEVTFGDSDLDEETQLLIFNTEGLPTNCFAYNVFWGNASATDQTVSTRNDIGMILLMSREAFYNTTPFAIQMVVHSPFMKINPFIDGFSVKPCTSYKMYMEKIQNHLLPSPYSTNCTDYRSMWRLRGGVGPLTKKMCVDECIFNKSIEMYGCFDPLEIDHPNETALFCFNKNVDESSIDHCDKMCQLACYDERIQVQIEEMESSLTSNQEDKKQCSTRIEISFIRTQVQKFIYNKKYEGIEAFGYIGGFLGMWLGLSLIAVFDFLETCFVILMYCAKQLKRQNKKTRIKQSIQKQMFMY